MTLYLNFCYNTYSMKTTTLMLDTYQTCSLDLQKNLAEKLFQLKTQTSLSILGPMLQSLPLLNKQSITLQVDSFHLTPLYQTIILGDADSVAPEHKIFFDYLFPTEKNFTDFEALITLVKEKSCATDLHFYGFWGGRFDHQHVIPCQISELLLQNSNVRSAWIYDEKNCPRLEILASGIHNFNEQISFSIITPRAQSLQLQGKVEYSGEIIVPAWSGLGLSNKAFGQWSLQCELPIWKYILSN